MVGMFGFDLPGIGAGLDATVTAIEADMIDGDVIHHRPVVDGGDVNAAAEMVVGGVIAELAVIPVTAVVTMAEVAEAVVHAAVEADGRTPVAAVPQVGTAVPAPVARGPEVTRFRRLYPGSGHPVVAAAVLGPGPVARRPD